MSTCDYEEANTRLMAHIIDTLNKVQSTFLVHIVNTNIVAILVGKFFHITALNSTANIWVAFGTGKNQWPLNTICHNLKVP